MNWWAFLHGFVVALAGVALGFPLGTWLRRLSGKPPLTVKQDWAFAPLGLAYALVGGLVWGWLS